MVIFCRIRLPDSEYFERFKQICSASKPKFAQQAIDTNHFIIILEEMGTRDFLGQHDLIVMLAVLRLGREAYGVPIGAEIEHRTGRQMLQGSVYSVLERLESRGLITSRLGEATPQRGGRAKRYFALTAAGIRQVHEMQRALESLWKDLPRATGAKS